MKKIAFHFVLVLFVIALITCQEKKIETAISDETSSPSDTIQLPVIKGLKPLLRLTKDGQASTENWVVYKALVQSLDSLDQGTIGDAKKFVGQLDKAFLDLQEAQEAAIDPMPSDLQTKAIKARFNALETQIKALKNEVSKNDPNPEAIVKGIARSKNALQDLNLQINERFAMSIEEMMEAANETIDSLVTPTNPQIKDTLNPNN